MSRIGRAPITIPAGVDIAIEGTSVTVQGPKGVLAINTHPNMTVAIADGVMTVTRPNDSGPNRSLHGLTRTLLSNMVTGVTAGYTRRLEVSGVGYRVQQAGSNLILQLGFSHPVQIDPPEGVTLAAEGNNKILVSGIDKELVGETAARIRRMRKPEPYKGKGIRYAEEQVRRKVGKTGGKKK